jgi:hypothetical protein
VIRLAVGIALLLLHTAPAIAAAQSGADAVATIGTLSGSRVTLDIGADAGVKPGLEATVWYELTIGGARKRVNVARIRITSVQPQSAEAAVVASTERLQAGYRVSFESPLEAPPGKTRPGGMPPGKTPQLLPECRGHLFVKTEPSGASVRIDGRLLDEKSPTLAEGLPCGLHRVTITLGGHEEADRQVTVQSGRPEQLLVTLTSRRARVRIAARPDGVDVFLNGQRRGQAPVIVDDLEWGEYRLRLEKAGFVAVERTLTVNQASVDESFVLAPAVAAVAPTVSLRISTFGFEATSGIPGILTLGLLASQYAIEVDDKIVMDWQIRSDEMSLEVLPGTHRLRILVRNILVRAADPVHDERIVVAAGRENPVNVNFLTNHVSVNGTERPFTYMSWQNQRR